MVFRRQQQFPAASQDSGGGAVGCLAAEWATMSIQPPLAPRPRFTPLSFFSRGSESCDMGGGGGGDGGRFHTAAADDDDASLLLWCAEQMPQEP